MEESKKSKHLNNSHSSERARPLGVFLLGGINFFLLGLGSLLVSAFLYLYGTSFIAQALFKEINSYLPQASENTVSLRVVFGLQTIIATIFLFSGLGIMLKKEWGRRLSLGLAFSVVMVSFIAALSNYALIGQTIVQIIYPGILIMYFTNKNIVNYFTHTPVRLGRTARGSTRGQNPTTEFKEK